MANAIHRFESYTKFRDFRQFHIAQAIAFKADLGEQRHARTQAPLSKATLLSILNALKAFFQWLAGQPGYKSRLKYADADAKSFSEHLASLRGVEASFQKQTERRGRSKALCGRRAPSSFGDT